MLAVATPESNPLIQPAVQKDTQPARPLLASLAPSSAASPVATLPRFTPEQASLPETPAPVVTDLPDLSKSRPMFAALSPEDGGQPTPTSDRKLFAFASAAGSFPQPESSSSGSRFPLYESADVVGAPEADDDHPDELSYVPFEIASLMTDASVAHDRAAADLSPPEQDDLSYLFEDMERPIAASFRPRSRFQGLAAAQRFTGDAVRNVYAEIGPAGPTHIAQR